MSLDPSKIIEIENSELYAIGWIYHFASTNWQEDRTSLYANYHRNHIMQCVAITEDIHSSTISKFYRLTMKRPGEPCSVDPSIPCFYKTLVADDKKTIKEKFDTYGIIMDTLTVNVMFSRFDDQKQLTQFCGLLQQNPKFILRRKLYQKCLINLLINNCIPKLLIQTCKNKYNWINREYTLFIHLITHPKSPQIWRKIKVHGSISMKELSNVIRLAMNWAQYANAQFGDFLNCDRFSFSSQHTHRFRLQLGTILAKFPQLRNHAWLKPSKKHKLFENFIGIRDPSQHTLDGCIWDGWLGTELDANDILLGQIAPFFINNNDNKDSSNTHPIPNDTFLHTFYPKYYQFLQKHSKKAFNFEFNQTENDMTSILDNCVYNRSDCLQWVYDIGCQWIHNIYFENGRANANFNQSHAIHNTDKQNTKRTL